MVIIGYFILINILCYPLLLNTVKNKNSTKAILVPMTISIIIIFGYFFYFLNIVKYYPISCISILTTLNLLLYLKKKHKPNTKKNFRPNFMWVATIAILTVTMVFSRFYDSITYNSPGNPDSLAHLHMYRELASQGYISNAFYAPGFHLILLPLSNFVNSWDLMRFIGPVISLLCLLSVYVIFFQLLKNKFVALLTLSLFGLPLFIKLSIQTIGFFPSAITFMVLPIYLYLIINPNLLDFKKNLIIFTIISIALALTVPYLLVQLIPLYGVLWFFTHFLKNKEKNKYIKLFKYKSIVLILCFLLALMHVYYFTKIHHNQSLFPNIPTIEKVGEKQIVGNNYQDIEYIDKLFKKYKNSNNIVIQILANSLDNSIVKTFFLPITSTGYEIIQPKNILLNKNILSIGGWLFLICLFPLLLYSLKTNKIKILVISCMGIIFGIGCQTGILEMSYYRGRTAWYFMMIMILTIGLLLDEMYKNRSNKLIILTIIIFCFISISNPPVFPRLHYSDAFAFTRYISKKTEEKVVIFTEQQELSIVSEKIQIFPIDEIEQISPQPKPIYLILPNKSIDKVDIYSHMIFSPEKDIYLLNNKSQNDTILNKFDTIREYIKSLPNELVLKTEQIDVYKLY